MMREAPIVAPDAAAVLDAAVRRLDAAGIAGARRDAQVLWCHATGWTPENLLARANAPAPIDRCERFQALIERRLARQPISQIIGRREFWSLGFRVSPDTLTPRPDSETVIEASLGLLDDLGVARDDDIRIVDFGTGTGCLLLSMLDELPQARGLGLDCCPAALAVARDNARDLGLAARAHLELWDWRRNRVPDSAVLGCFDLALANPPYIPDDEFNGLAPEVARHEPRLALAGGPDGLDGYRRLAPWFGRFLRPGGQAVVEVGAGQADAVQAILERAGGRHLKKFRDLAGIDRCISARFG